MYGGSCCVAGGAAWLVGGAASRSTPIPSELYSWRGPGQLWQPHPPCPDDLGVYGSLVFDGHHTLWALGGSWESGVWTFDIKSNQWSTMECQPRWKIARGLLCGRKFIIQAGGEEEGEEEVTSTIRLFDVTTGDYSDSPTTLQHSVRHHCAISIYRTN